MNSGLFHLALAVAVGSALLAYLVSDHEKRKAVYQRERAQTLLAMLVDVCQELIVLRSGAAGDRVQQAASDFCRYNHPAHVVETVLGKSIDATNLLTSLTVRGYQIRTANWVGNAFGYDSAGDVRERALRLFEEATELAQAVGVPRSEMVAIMGEVLSKEPGDVFQEIGGVALTLAATATAANVLLGAAIAVELNRVEDPDVMQRCRTKEERKRQLVAVLENEDDDGPR